MKQAVIFDLGGVLLDWSPEYLFERLISDGARRAHFLEHVCSLAWHYEQDKGRPIQDAMAARMSEHPDFAEPIRAFYACWADMFRGPVEANVAVLQQLKDNSYPLYALSNYPAGLRDELWQVGPFMDLFDDVILSGEEGIAKPDPAIFHLALERFGLRPAQTVFIDDVDRNIAAAEAVGMTAVHCPPETDLSAALRSVGIA